MKFDFDLQGALDIKTALRHYLKEPISKAEWLRISYEIDYINKVVETDLDRQELEASKKKCMLAKDKFCDHEPCTSAQEVDCCVECEFMKKCDSRCEASR